MPSDSGKPPRRRRPSAKGLAKLILEKYQETLQEEHQSLREMTSDPEGQLWIGLPYIIQDVDVPQTFADFMTSLETLANKRTKPSNTDIANLTAGHKFLEMLTEADEKLLEAVKRENPDAYVTVIQNAGMKLSPDEMLQAARRMMEAARQDQENIQQRIDVNRDILDFLGQILDILDKPVPPPGR